jgi:DNA-binding Xre family transcriptional regulator
VGRVYLRAGEVAQARGRRNIRQLAQATGLAYTTAHVLMRHPERVEGITFETLARLAAYLDCGPADLLGYGPPGDYALSLGGALDEEYLPREPAASPARPDTDEEEEEDYLLPEQWRRLHPDALLSPGGTPASEQDTEPRRREWNAQAAAPGPEPGAQPMPPRQVGLYESI